MLTVPESVIKTLQENLFAFLRKNRKDKIERAAKSKKGDSILLSFARLFYRYVWLGLADYWTRLTINGRQSSIITLENMAAFYFSSNAIMT